MPLAARIALLVALVLAPSARGFLDSGSGSPRPREHAAYELAPTGGGIVWHRSVALGTPAAGRLRRPPPGGR